MDVVAFGGRVLLMLVFAVAAAGKLIDPGGTRQAMMDFRVPNRLVRPAASLLPLVEILVAVLLLLQATALVGAIGAAVLLLVFMGGVGGAMARGEAPDCNCFGQIGSAPAGRATLLRNGALVLVAVLVAVEAPGRNPESWLAASTHHELVVLVLSLLVVLLVAAVSGLWTERRTLRADLTVAKESLSQFPPGLPAGAQAPSFVLPSAGGDMVALSDLLSRGRPIALMFISPSCRPCHYMLPDVSRWQRTLSARLTIALVATGTAAEARDLAQKFGLQDLLYQPEPEVFTAFRANGTPSVVIITPDGRIANRMRSSHGAVEAAIRRALQNPPTVPDDAPDTTLNGVREDARIEVNRWSGSGAQPA